ncbi:hypothetical protein FOL47_010667, partial [Perkinsus chesapeaki]
MPNPVLSIRQKLLKWVKEHSWLETSEDADGSILYRCSLCCLNPTSGVVGVEDGNHAESVKLAAAREVNNSFWKGQVSRMEAEKDKRLMGYSPLVQNAIWLAREEISIVKFESLAEHCKLLGSSLSTEFHATRYSSWEFIESIDIVLMRKNADTIRNAVMHGIILDTVIDSAHRAQRMSLPGCSRARKLAVLARCIDSEGVCQVILWDLITIGDGKGATIAEAIRNLHIRDNIDVSRCYSWTSDGASAMVLAAQLAKKEPEGGWIACHCMAHRLDLAVSCDTWKKSNICQRIERSLRIVYNIFNRSGQRRKELKRLEGEFGRLVIPAALQDVRWLSKLQCLDIFYSSKDAIAAFISSQKQQFRDNTDYDFLLETIDEHSEDVLMLLRLLRPCGLLTKRLQERSLDLWGAQGLLESTTIQLKNIQNLSADLSSLRDALVDHLMERFPINEASWMSLLDMSHEYPDGVVKAKFNQILGKLKLEDPELKAVDFARDYQLVRNEYFRLKAAGAVIPDIHNIKPPGLSVSWAFYDNICRVVSPTSADAERVFSALSRHRSRFRRRLHIHLPALVRISMSKTIGASSQPSDEAFIREVLRTWDGSKQRRRRAKRLGPVPKKPRREIRSEPPIGSTTDSDPSEDDMVIQQADARESRV